MLLVMVALLRMINSQLVLGNASSAVTICAIIEHTQGASEYGFISFAAMAVRAVRELNEPPVVVFPLSLGGLSLDMLYTEQSLAALARHAGFRWSHDRGACASPDVVVGDHVTTHDGIRAQLKPQGRQQLATAMNFPMHGAAGLLQGLWTTLRVLARRGKLPDASNGVNGERSLRVSLALYSWSAGPLAHAHAILRAETLTVLQLLEPSVGVAMRVGWNLPPPVWSATSLIGMEAALQDQADCAYLFLRSPVVNGVWAFTEVNVTQSPPPGDRKFRNFKVIEGSKMTMEHVANASMPLIRQAGLTCVRVSALTRPDQSSLLSAFARADPGVRVRMSNMVGVEPGRATQSNRWLHKGADPALVLPNVHERFFAYSAPLLISEVGTHWTDFILGKRAQRGRPSVVLEVPLGAGHVQPRWIDTAHRKCSFYRALCCLAWMSPMESEVHICHPPHALQRHRAGMVCLLPGRSAPHAGAHTKLGGAPALRGVATTASTARRTAATKTAVSGMALVSFLCNRTGVTAERGGTAAVQKACRGLSEENLRKWRYECDPTNGRASLTMAVQLGKNARRRTALPRVMVVRAVSAEAIEALRGAGWDVRDYRTFWRDAYEMSPILKQSPAAHWPRANKVQQRGDSACTSLKLLAWNMTEWDTVLMVDNDVCLIDDPGPWAQQHRNLTLVAQPEVASRGYQGLNSHFVMLHPDPQLARVLVEMGTSGSYLPYTNGDQDVIETVFAARQRMPTLPNHTHSKKVCGIRQRSP